MLTYACALCILLVTVNAKHQHAGRNEMGTMELGKGPTSFFIYNGLPRMEQNRLCVNEKVVPTNQGAPRLSQILPRGSALVAGTLSQHRLATHVNQSHTILSRPNMVDTMLGPGEPSGIMAGMARPGS